MLWAEFDAGGVTTTGGDLNDEWLVLLVQQGLDVFGSPTLDAGMLKVGFKAIKAGLLGVIDWRLRGRPANPRGCETAALSLRLSEQLRLDTEINGFLKEGLLGLGIAAVIRFGVAKPQRCDQAREPRW